MRCVVCVFGAFDLPTTDAEEGVGREWRQCQCQNL